MRGLEFGKGPLCCEGAMGTMLQSLGADVSAGALHLNADDPDAVARVHSMYREAGATCGITNSFNPCTSLDSTQAEASRKLVAASVGIAREAGFAIVLGDMGPAGKMLEPLGDTTFDELYRIYRRHIDALVEAGADAIMIETLIDVSDARCALLAALDATRGRGVPVVASLSFNESCRMPLSSTTPAAAAHVMEMMGASMVGSNCGLGHDQMMHVIEQMSEATALPLIVQPNAGMPVSDAEGNASYPGTPEQMAVLAPRFAELGCAIIGSCCGSTPEFTRAIVDTLAQARVQAVERGRMLSGEFALTSVADIVVSENGKLECSDGCTIDCDEGLDKWEILENASEFPMILRFKGSLDALELALKHYSGVAAVCVRDAGECAEIAHLAMRYGAYAAIECEDADADARANAASAAQQAGLDASRVLLYDGASLVAIAR